MNRPTPIWRSRAQASLNLGGRHLNCYNLRLMLKILYAGFLGLSLGISSQFTPEMCTAARNCEKLTTTPSFGGLSSLKVIDVDKAKKPVTSACYDKQHVCTYLQSFSHYTSR